jgi:hypothetical protein
VSDDRIMWQTWTELIDHSGQWYWMPMTYQAMSAEQAADKAVEYYDSHRLEIGSTLRTVKVAPMVSVVEFQLERNPLPMFRRSQTS